MNAYACWIRKHTSIQVCTYCAKCESFRFTLPTGNLFTKDQSGCEQENSEKASMYFPVIPDNSHNPVVILLLSTK